MSNHSRDTARNNSPVRPTRYDCGTCDVMLSLYFALFRAGYPAICLYTSAYTDVATDAPAYVVASVAPSARAITAR